MLGIKSIQCARAIIVGIVGIAGIETLHRIKKKQLDFVEDRTSSTCEKFYSLAF